MKTREPRGLRVSQWMRHLGAIVLLITGVAAPSAAQQDASIVGVVTDESGAALPGVTVTATSPSLQVPSVTTVTNERGEYRLTPLPIGVFSVVYELSGFQSVRRDGIKLTTGFVATVNVPMGIGAVQETLTVTGASPVVDVSNTQRGTRLVEPKTRKSEKRFVCGTPSGVIC